MGLNAPMSSNVHNYTISSGAFIEHYGWLETNVGIDGIDF